MNSRCIARVKRLEARLMAGQEVRYRIGLLKPLPAGLGGPSHIVITRLEPVLNGIQWCEFEERDGPMPLAARDVVPRCYLSQDDMRL